MVSGKTRGPTLVISALEGVKWAESATKAALLSALGVPHGFERGQSGAEPQHHRQVHGVTILEAHPERSAPGLAARAAADGIFSQKVGERIAVKTADCVPVLIGDRGRRLVMAVHAGWRGLTQGILPEAVALAAATASRRRTWCWRSAPQSAARPSR